MMQLTKEQVRHIAKLARLRLTENEVSRFSKELTSILQYVNVLQEVETNGVEATAQVAGQTNVLREDVVRNAEADPDRLLSCSPLPLSDHQIVSPAAHG